jgi:hypothetical protein
MRTLSIAGKSTATVVLFLSAACAQNSPATSSIANPVAPAQNSASTAASGATITGTLNRNLSALSVRPFADSTLTVSVVGSSATAIVDTSGRFSLQNVPAGDLTLQFEGAGINARVTVTGVRADDRIDIMLRLNGAVVEIEQETREHGNELEPEPEHENEIENENEAAEQHHDADSNHGDGHSGQSDDGGKSGKK